MKRLIMVAAIVFATNLQAAPVHPCAVEASKQAQRLLSFHAGPDKRVAMDKAVKVRPAMKNPSNKKQMLDVLEVWGYIDQGQYRMRLVYAPFKGECLLMGQGVLEHTSP